MISNRSSNSARDVPRIAVHRAGAAWHTRTVEEVIVECGSFATAKLVRSALATGGNCDLLYYGALNARDLSSNAFLTIILKAPIAGADKSETAK